MQALGDRGVWGAFPQRMDDLKANQWWPKVNRLLRDLIRILNATEASMWAVDNEPRTGKRATDKEKREVWRDLLQCLEKTLNVEGNEDSLRHVVKKRHDELGAASSKFKQIAQNKVKAREAKEGLDDSFFLTNVQRLTTQIKTNVKLLGTGFRRDTSSAMKALYQDEANRAHPDILDVCARIRAISATPASGGCSTEGGGVAPTTKRKLEDAVATTARPPSPFAFASASRAVLTDTPASGGSSTEGRGVAQQLKKSDAPTGDTSPTKRKLQDGGDGDEGWHDRTTVDLMRGCLESHTNPQGFLDLLETYEGGQICEKMFNDSRIKGFLWKMGTYKKGPIVGRAVRLWDKWEETAYDKGWYSTIAVSLLRGCLLSDDPEKFLQWFELYPDGKISKKVFIEAGIKKTLCRLELHHDRAIANRATELRRKWKTEEVERRKKIPRT